MDFDFSDDQQQLREAARRWVEKAYTFEHRRAAVQAGGFQRESWNALAELGLTALNVPEAHGGMGMGAVEAMVVMEEIGRGMVLEPLAQSFLAARVISQFGSEAVQAAWLPRIASGEALVVLAHQERRARYRLDICESKASQTPDGYALTAQKSIVLRAIRPMPISFPHSWMARSPCSWSSAARPVSAPVAMAHRTAAAPLRWKPMAAPPR